MTAALWVLLAVAFGTSARAESSGKNAAPVYSAESIVNWATGNAGLFAPNVIVSLYGTDLAWGEEALGKQHVAAGFLPTELANTRVLIMHGKLGTPVPLYYAGPKQINFVLPDSMDPGDVEITVVRQGIYGAPARITVQDTAPALLQLDGETARATDDSYRLLTPDNPARPGAWVVLYATGLGPTTLRLKDGEIPSVPPLTLAGITIKRLSEFKVMLAGTAVERPRIIYVGLMPGSVGIYQINLQLPDQLPADPEIRIAVGDRLSPAGIKLTVRP